MAQESHREPLAGTPTMHKCQRCQSPATLHITEIVGPGQFEELHLSTAVVPVETVLEGPIDDDAALHGLLRRIEALGLELVEVRRLAPSDPEA